MPVVTRIPTHRNDGSKISKRERRAGEIIDMD
jgi:hypothetical protein